MEKYLVYTKNGLNNPFMHIKQKPNGEFCFRFLNVTDERFDFHYTRHNNEFHTITYYKGIEKAKKKTDIKPTKPVFDVDKLERIRAIIVTDSTASRTPTEEIKNLPSIMEINSSLYPKGLINMVIYLNPKMPLDEVIKITQPTQYIQDNSFNPPVLILCFKHSIDFLKLGVDMI